MPRKFVRLQTLIIANSAPGQSLSKQASDKTLNADLIPQLGASRAEQS